MDKIKVNNQIVLMRKLVKQAKTRIINKLVKHIKLLENRKGDDEKISKCKRKAKRFLLEVAILKKIRPDYVSKMALSKSKDWQSVLSQKNIPLEERCFAMVASYKPLQNEVEKFHSTNSYLIPRIPILIQEWEEKGKFSGESNKIRKRLKKGNETLHNRIIQKKESVTSNSEEDIVDHVQNNIDSDCNQLPCEETQFMGLNSCELILNSENEEKSKDKNKAPTDSYENCKSMHLKKNLSKNENKKAVVSLNQNDDSDSETNNKSVKGLHKSQPKDLNYSYFKKVQDSSFTQKRVVETRDLHNLSNFSGNNRLQSLNEVTKDMHVKPTGSSNSTKAVALLNLNELSDLDEIPIKNIGNDEDLVQETGMHKRDSFFLADHAQIESENDEDENIKDNKQWEKDSFPPRKKFNKLGFADSYPKNALNTFKRGKLNQNNFKSSKDFSCKINFKENKTFNKKFHSKDHPNSYETSRAKQHINKNEKFKSINPKNSLEHKTLKSESKIFQKNHHKNTTQKERCKVNNFVRKDKVAEQLPLHPSWEAKRKLKEHTKAKFQGKRMLFDD